MGMNFSPMYQPVSTKTIKADGDLNVDPYDVIAVDGKFDTVEANEFIGSLQGNVNGTINGNVEGYSSGINKHYNIGVSDVTTFMTEGGHFVYGPFVSGVTYSGSIKGKGSYSGMLLLTLSTEGVWTKQSFAQSGIETVTFENVLAVIVSGSTTQVCDIYLPTYTEV